MGIIYHQQCKQLEAASLKLWDFRNFMRRMSKLTRVLNLEILHAFLSLSVLGIVVVAGASPA